MTSDDKHIQVETRGSYFITQHTERTVKAYAIYDNELNSLALFNAITGLFASIGTGLLAFTAGLIVDVMKAPEEITRPQIVDTICVICIILAIVCYSIAAIAFYFRHSTLSDIRKKSKPAKHPKEMPTI